MSDEYIKREDAIKWLNNLFDDCGNYMPLWHYGEVLPKIIELLEVDVAPVVRCGDCLFCQMELCEGADEPWCDIHHTTVDTEAFCSWGERRRHED